MRAFGIGADLMSLGGIAIAIGEMIDAAIVMVENMHQQLEKRAPTVSFIPVFTLEGQKGRLFKPFALTKACAMAAASLLGITHVPMLMALVIRGRIYRGERTFVRRGG